MFIKSKLLLICLAMFGLTTCSPSGEHHPVGASPGKGTVAGEAIGYDKVRPIFATYCSACHPSRSGPNWLDYNQARPYATNGRLNQRVFVEKSMPPPGSAQAAAISQDDRKLIAQWARSGGPQQIQAGENQSPDNNSTADAGAAQSCLECHGVNASRAPGIARINGQNQSYIERQLMLFKRRERIDPSTSKMNEIAAALSDSEIEEVAQFFSKPRKPATQEPDRLSQLKDGREKLLYTMGEKYAAVNCVSCHMNPEFDRLPSEPMVPILAGQSKQYLIDQLLYFRDNERRNKEMHMFAKDLTYENIEALAIYFTTVDDGH